MGIRPMDLPVSPPSDVENIRRVERKSDAHDFEQRQPPGREGSGPHSRPEEMPEDTAGEPEPTAHDMVEISAQYQTEPHASREERESSPPPAETSPEPQRHLDIQA